MKAMLLAAGRGERLRPLTDVTPKPMLELAGTTLIEHQLTRLQAAGITEVVINLHHLGQKIIDRLGNGANLGLSIEYSHEQELLETGGGILQALSLLGEAPFIVVSADTFHDIDYRALPQALDNDLLGLLVMVENPRHHAAGDFAIDPHGRLSHEGARLTYSGTAVLAPDLVRETGERVFKLRRVFDPAISAGRLQGVRHEGYWYDVGTPERYDELRRRFDDV